MQPASFQLETAKRRTGSVILPPDPDPITPPPVGGNAVTVGSTWKLMNTLKGWTSTHKEIRSATSKAVIGACSEIQNQHCVGFGTDVDPEIKVTWADLTSNVVTLTTTEHDGWAVGDKINVYGLGSPFDGTDYVITALTATTVKYNRTFGNTVMSGAPPPNAGARNFSFLDKTFGYPTKTTGYFSNSQYLCLTACGCPNYMKTPPAGASPNPMGTPSAASQTDQYTYVPPNWANFQRFADFIAACVARYPHLTHVQVWNEDKGFYIGTQASGSNIVPTGSGLGVDSTLGRNNNRWWSEGYQDMYNRMWTACKAVRSSIKIVGPYCVLNSFVGLTNATDWSNDAFPMDYKGSWGYGDKKVMSRIMYFIRYCTGCDSLCMDIRNLQKDSSVGGFYNPASVPATPDPTNAWLSNPEGGIHERYWSDGYEDGAWVNGQRQVDFMTWLRALGASSPLYQRSVCDARSIHVWWAEWYAYSNRPQFKHADPRTGNYYTAPTSNESDESAAFAWQFIWSVLIDSDCCMFWQPEGYVQGNAVDPADSNPLALYKDNDPSSTGLTKLYPVSKGFKDYFPKGIQLYTLTSNMPKVWGLATDNTIMLVSRDSQPRTFALINPKNNTPNTITLAGYEVRYIAR